jgi:hypothetical protein
MRFTRAAKVAAFPLTALILVALIACQGPIGPKGDPGPQGTTGGTGPTGGTGTPGEPGVSSLLVSEGGKTYGRYINDSALGRIGTLPTSLNTSMQFTGGKPPVKFAAAGLAIADDGSTTFLVKKADDFADSGMVTVEIRDRNAEQVIAAGLAPDYAIDNGVTFTEDGEVTSEEAATNSRFTVTATDADGYTASKAIEILRNRRPVASDTDWGPFDVGTQDAKMARTDADTNLNCTHFNSCKVTVAATHFNDESRDGLTYTVISNSAPLKLRASIDGDKVVLVGLASTWNKDKLTRDTGDNADAKGDHDDVELLIRAIDDGDMYDEKIMVVQVDGRPTPKTPIPSVKVDQGASEVMNVVNGVIAFFEDAETGIANQFTLESNNPALVSVPTGDQNGSVDLTPLNVGSVTITVTVTETTDTDGGLSQTASQEFTVTVE